MDKYEFNIKVEQIKKLVTKGDYETSMKIADSIDWRRVRNANLLAMISQVYEKNGEYQEAKEVLLLAFERAPIAKRLLYKLTELALKEGSVQEAEDYYREFCDMAPDDSRQHLLRYMILKEKGASNEQLIHSLERYTSTELDEKWMYELASLYSKTGMSDLCVRTCDKIMLMFGLGKYVEKAMDLKLQYAPLNKYQMDLEENRDKYEARLREVEQEYDVGGFEPDSRRPGRPERAKRVGVFVDSPRKEVERKAERFGLQVLQLHGGESPDYCRRLRETLGLPLVKAFHLAETEDLRRTEPYEGLCDFFLFEPLTCLPGGSGKTLDWQLLHHYEGRTPFLLSGGIGPDSIEALRRFHHPRWAGIDLNSRFELAPGLKDVERLGQFLQALTINQSSL